MAKLEFEAKRHVFPRTHERPRRAKAFPQVGDIGRALARRIAALGYPLSDELGGHGRQSSLQHFASQARSELGIAGFELARRDSQQMVFDERARLPRRLLVDIVPV